MRFLDRFDGRERAPEPVVLALVVERLFAGPGRLDYVEILARAGIAFIFCQKVTVLLEFLIAAAGNDMNAGPSVCEMIECCELACRHGGRGEPRSMSDHQVDTL